MDRIFHSADITDGRRQLLETLAGHFALLKLSHPRKAASATAQKAHRLIESHLRSANPRKRAA